VPQAPSPKPSVLLLYLQLRPEATRENDIRNATPERRGERTQTNSWRRCAWRKREGQRKTLTQPQETGTATGGHSSRTPLESSHTPSGHLARQADRAQEHVHTPLGKQQQLYSLAPRGPSRHSIVAVLAVFEIEQHRVERHTCTASLVTYSTGSPRVDCTMPGRYGPSRSNTWHVAACLSPTPAIGCRAYSSGHERRGGWPAAPAKRAIPPRRSRLAGLRNYRLSDTQPPLSASLCLWAILTATLLLP